MTFHVVGIINLCLSVLREARLANTKMWKDFIGEHDINKNNWNSFGIALWVSDWWKQDLAGEHTYDADEPKDEHDGSPWKKSHDIRSEG